MNKQIEQDMIEIGELLWSKNLASGLNGNISARLEDGTILLTAHGSCLGKLNHDDIVHCDLKGKPVTGGAVSTEKFLHTEIFKNIKDVRCIVHTHTSYTNGFFLENEKFNARIFEAKMNLGEVIGIEQLTPAVTDPVPVVEALKINHIVALRNHGIVAIGNTFFDCFCLIQGLEEAIKTDVVARIYNTSAVTRHDVSVQENRQDNQSKKFKLFSQEQIDEIVKHVNADENMKVLGEKTDMTFDLAVKMNETGQTYCFEFQRGNINNVTNNEDAEFLISAPENVWRSVFNKEIDPFVATTQKKMHLKGDFAKISKFYAPCSRVFELWLRVPVD